MRHLTFLVVLLAATACSGGKHTGALTTAPSATATAASTPAANASPAASTQPPGSPATAAPVRSATPSPKPGPSHNFTVSEGDNGHVITVRRRDEVTAVLHSTYWQFNKPSDQRVLLAEDDPVVSPQPQGCVPGQGCGTVTVRYLAVGAGRSVISAHRDTCGEAMRCTPAQSDWRVTVVVTGS